jgi:hypothetical protein
MSAEPEAELPHIIVAPPSPAVRRSLPAGPPPRFGVGHLLLIAFFCSAYLALLRFLSPGEPGTFGVAIAAVRMPISGLAGMGLTVFISRRIRRSSWPIEPGEWLLAIEGAWFLAAAVKTCLIARSDPDWHAAAAVEAIHCGLFALPVFDRRLTGIWKPFFLTYVVVHALTAALFASVGEGAWQADVMQFWMEYWEYMAIVRPAAAVLFTSVAIGWDFKDANRRGWLHWVGLFVFVTEHLGGLVLLILANWLA